MQIITKILDRKIEYNNYFEGRNACFFDIETTGLSSSYNFIYLIGILYYQEDKWKITQIFADSAQEEEEVLREFLNIIRGYNLIISYNGNSFDIPFINHRLEKYKIDSKVDQEISLDLYRVVRDNKQYLKLDNLKLKTLERYLGLYRDDIYSGKDCIDFYLNYSKNKDKKLAEKVLNHNFDDLYYMLDILRILDIIKEKKTISIQYEDSVISLFLHDFYIKGDLFIVCGSVSSQKQIKLMYFDNSFKLKFIDDGSFELVLEVNQALVTPDTKGIYIDKKNVSLSKSLIDNTIYDLPHNIILLKVEKEFCIDNIIGVVKDIVLNSLKEF